MRTGSVEVVVMLSSSMSHSHPRVFAAFSHPFADEKPLKSDDDVEMLKPMEEEKSEEIPQRFSRHFSSSLLNFSFPIFTGNDYRYVQMGI